MNAIMPLFAVLLLAICTRNHFPAAVALTAWMPVVAAEPADCIITVSQGYRWEFYGHYWTEDGLLGERSERVAFYDQHFTRDGGPCSCSLTLPLLASAKL